MGIKVKMLIAGMFSSTTYLLTPTWKYYIWSSLLLKKVFMAIISNLATLDNDIPSL
jgi:hypothetical protein